MKRENGICLLAFLIGVIVTNLLGADELTNSGLLNKYNLATLSFRGIVYEEYFLHVLLLRLQTVAALWLFSKIFSKKLITVLFAGGVCAMLGAIVAMAILVNGIWGILFWISALLPHGFFYGSAYWLWSKENEHYTMADGKRKKVIVTVFILILVVIGCICEAYLGPILIEKVIKF